MSAQGSVIGRGGAMTNMKREDLLAMAQQAKLMIRDGERYYINDMATERELLAFVRLLGSACAAWRKGEMRAPGGD
jgi:hypothetical protein